MSYDLYVRIKVNADREGVSKIARILAHYAEDWVAPDEGTDETVLRGTNVARGTVIELAHVLARRGVAAEVWDEAAGPLGELRLVHNGTVSDKFECDSDGRVVLRDDQVRSAVAIHGDLDAALQHLTGASLREEIAGAPGAWVTCDDLVY